MVKRIILCFCLVFLTSCGEIESNSIEKATEYCSHFGGLDSISITGAVREAFCKDGVIVKFTYGFINDPKYSN